MKTLICAVALLASTAAHADKTLRFYNWKDYIDPAVIEEFQKESGITVETHSFTTTDELVQTMASGAAYDVVVPSHFMLRQLLAENRLARIDNKRLSYYPSLDPWVTSALAGISDANSYTVPYLWGSIGLLINPKLAEANYGGPAPDSWSLLFDEQQAAKLAKCGLGMLDAAEETSSLLLNYRGHSLATSTARQIERNLRSLQPVAKQLRSFDNWRFIDEMVANRLCVSMSWSGHAILAKEKNPELRYVIPVEGAAIYIDTLAIPANAPHQELAYQFIDFLLQPDNAIRNARATRFYAPLPSSSPQMQALSKSSPDQLLSTEQRRRSYLLENLEPNQRASLNQAWQQFRASRN